MNSCAIPGCSMGIPRTKLMCPPHWRMVPVWTRKRVYEEYRAGYSREYLEARDDAITAVVVRLLKRG